VALVVTLGTDQQGLENISDGLSPGVVVVLSDGTTFGEPYPGQGSLVETARIEQATVTALVEDGWEIALPVIGSAGVAVVDAFATDEELTEGVVQAWGLLTVLGMVLIGIAVWVADRLGRRLVVPMRELAGAAHLMSEGDLEVRVDTQSMNEVPTEIVEVGEAFNLLASRLDHLLMEEREAVANLSHRLRTPLTSLKLQAEKIGQPSERQDTLAQVEKLEAAIDRLIESSRTKTSAHVGTCEIDVVAAERSAFWSVLADEQDREFVIALDADGAQLGLPCEDVGVVIDTLIGNVFAHTPSGTAFRLETGRSGARMWIELSDDGPGFPESPVVDRGASGRGSTGLGLDIVRRTAELTGGSIALADGPTGGAVVRVWFG
jgi:signal transduction histidine kinase